MYVYTHKKGWCEMKEFIEKLIGRLEEEVEYQDKKADEADVFEEVSVSHTRISMRKCYEHAIEIVNELAEEYKGGCCEWEYDEFEDGWQTSCGTTFSLCDSDKEVTHFCPCCGKEIKVVE